MSLATMRLAALFQNTTLKIHRGHKQIARVVIDCIITAWVDFLCTPLCGSGIPGIDVCLHEAHASFL